MIPSLSITRPKTLTNAQASSVLSLAALCCQNDRISLSYPVFPEDNAIHYLLTDQKGQLLSALAGIPLDCSAIECIAFTHPKHRKRGYFSRLLSLALKEWEDLDILFPVSGACPDTMAVLSALDAKLEYEEYKMEYIFPENGLCRDSFFVSRGSLLSSFLSPPNDIFAENACWTLFLSDCPPSLERLSKTKGASASSLLDGTGGCSARPAGSADKDCIAGSCFTSPVSQNTLCIHHVEILAGLRGSGLGTLLIRQLIYCLQKTHIRRLLLHVSGSNAPAVALYKKTGFGITETLSYYMY